MFSSDKSVYISYAQGGESEEIVNQIAKALQGKGFEVIRNRTEPGDKVSIKDFMAHSRQENFVIVVMSDQYLRSPNRMFELTEIVENRQFHDRMFIILLSDANIYDPSKRIEYTKYWEARRTEMADDIRKADPANLQGIREEMDLYDRIPDKISWLTSILKDTNTLSLEFSHNFDFSLLYDAIERWSNENSPIVPVDDTGDHGLSITITITVSIGGSTVSSSNSMTGNSKNVYVGATDSFACAPAMPEFSGPPCGSESDQAEEVAFTAYHPKEGKVEIWHTLLVYTHLLSAIANVQEDAKRFKDQIAVPKEVKSPAFTKILRGTEITIIPTCQDVTFNPQSVSFRWLEDFHRAEFRFMADKSLLDDAARGQIDIFAGPLIIGSLKFAMLFNEKAAVPTTDCEEHVKMYNKDDVFISYSRKDKEVARAFKTVLEATGFDVFLDVDDIRSGQYWQEELMRRIEQARIFQIFWSQNYSSSENCRAEWEYALKQNKEEGYIRPVFWENPLSPRPPEELNRFNFKYVKLG